MSKSVNTKTMTEQERLKRQRKGAVRTALIVGLVAIGVFALTLYMKSK